MFSMNNMICCYKKFIAFILYNKSTTTICKISKICTLGRCNYYLMIFTPNRIEIIFNIFIHTTKFFI